jgi:Ca2+-binding RTX toxin-like protein
MEDKSEWMGLQDDVEDLDANDSYADLIGTSSLDVLEGTQESEVISGRQGDDLILGRQGDDELIGGSGDDELYGNEGNNILMGGYGDDYLFAGVGDDELYGEEGDDTYMINDQSGDVLIFPDGAGLNRLRCQNVHIIGVLDEGDDVILELSSGAIITLIEQNLERTVDHLVDCEDESFDVNFDSVGAARSNDMGSYAGIYSSEGMEGNITGTMESEDLTGTDLSEYIRGLRGDDTISGSFGDDVINGNRGDDILRGDQGDDALNGGDGDDEVYGGEGDDILMGGSGHDHLYGGGGDDIYVYRGAHQVIEIHPEGEGHDILRCEGDLNQINRGWEGDDRILNMSNGGQIRIVDQRNSSTVDELIGCY